MTLNAEQLHTTCLELRKEIDSLGLLTELQQLATALQNSVNQPNQPQHQEQIGTSKNNLMSSLQRIESSERPVTKQHIIEEIGGSDLLGGPLKSRIEESFSQLDVTPALVQKDIAEMHSELESFREGIDQLIAGFERLDIETDELNGYVAELAILIPRRENADDLEFFSKDLKNLNRELQHFNELVTGSSEPFRIRSLSSSDYSVFLQFLPETAQAVVSTIALLLFGYEKLLDIRKKRADLVKEEAPEALIGEMDRWAESLMSEKIDQITDDLMEQFQDVDRADLRGNELKGHVRLSVKKLAGRIDVGYHFSARIGQVEEPSEEDAEDEELVAEYERKSDLIENIKTNASNIEYQSMDGEPVLPISWQPSSDEPDENV
jgi:hypothetical protein